MKFNKINFFLILLNLIGLVAVAVFFALFINVVNQLTDTDALIRNIFSSLLFLIPYIFFVAFSIKLLFFKDKSPSDKKHWRFSSYQWFLISAIVICSIVFIVYTYLGVVGISSAHQSVIGVSEGYIVAEGYTKEQLLELFNDRFLQNVFAVSLSGFTYLSFLWSWVLLFKKSK